ncbi:MAG: septum formation initiator family protein [Flavobacteriales bacterium]|nr:septum formation initiator family protein [Flavobacteriales bacterium]
MVTKKILTLAILSIVLLAAVYLLFQLNRAYEEFTHWKSREAVLEKELEDLRTEANDHRQFLDKLRRDPDFQDAVARKELGYGKSEERLYRFPDQTVLE